MFSHHRHAGPKLSGYPTRRLVPPTIIRTGIQGVPIDERAQRLPIQPLVAFDPLRPLAARANVLNNRAQFCDSHGSRVAPPRLRVGLPAPKRASLVARSVSEGTWAPWLALGRVVAVLSQNCARRFRFQDGPEGPSYIRITDPATPIRTFETNHSARGTPHGLLALPSHLGALVNFFRPADDASRRNTTSQPGAFCDLPGNVYLWVYNPRKSFFTRLLRGSRRKPRWRFPLRKAGRVLYDRLSTTRKIKRNRQNIRNSNSDTALRARAYYTFRASDYASARTATIVAHSP